ncbi:MAG: hypothetical protein IPO08_23640 [Xanthomonadales bacterium]|nr:hypothetical protein [Xanthomonadales bacterium]
MTKRREARVLAKALQAAQLSGAHWGAAGILLAERGLQSALEFVAKCVDNRAAEAQSGADHESKQDEQPT